ncbi:MAG: hypothetical protein WDW36_005896 [Sanguina aurantia]
MQETVDLTFSDDEVSPPGSHSVAATAVAAAAAGPVAPAPSLANAGRGKLSPRLQLLLDEDSDDDKVPLPPKALVQPSSSIGNGPLQQQQQEQQQEQQARSLPSLQRPPQGQARSNHPAVISSLVIQGLSSAARAVRKVVPMDLCASPPPTKTLARYASVSGAGHGSSHHPQAQPADEEPADPLAWLLDPPTLQGTGGAHEAVGASCTAGGSDLGSSPPHSPHTHQPSTPHPARAGSKHQQPSQQQPSQQQPSQQQPSQAANEDVPAKKARLHESEPPSQRQATRSAPANLPCPLPAGPPAAPSGMSRLGQVLLRRQREAQQQRLANSQSSTLLAGSSHAVAAHTPTTHTLGDSRCEEAGRGVEEHHGVGSGDQRPATSGETCYTSSSEGSSSDDEAGGGAEGDGRAGAGSFLGGSKPQPRHRRYSHNSHRCCTCVFCGCIGCQPAPGGAGCGSPTSARPAAKRANNKKLTGEERATVAAAREAAKLAKVAAKGAEKLEKASAKEAGRLQRVLDKEAARAQKQQDKDVHRASNGKHAGRFLVVQCSPCCFAPGVHFGPHLRTLLAERGMQVEEKGGPAPGHLVPHHALAAAGAAGGGTAPVAEPGV